MDENEKDGQLYELTYILEPQIQEEAVSGEVSQISILLEQHGATVVLNENPRLRGLAYTIEKSIGGKRRKFDQGYLGWIKFNALPESIPAINSELDGVNTIIRKLLIHGTKTSALSPMRARPQRSDPSGSDHKASEAEIDKEVEELIASAITTNVS